MIMPTTIPEAHTKYIYAGVDYILNKRRINRLFDSLLKRRKSIELGAWLDWRELLVVKHEVTKSSPPQPMWYWKTCCASITKEFTWRIAVYRGVLYLISAV